MYVLYTGKYVRTLVIIFESSLREVVNGRKEGERERQRQRETETDRQTEMERKRKPKTEKQRERL